MLSRRRLYARKEGIRKMKKWKDSLKGGRLLFIGEEHLMKRSGKTFSNYLL